MGKKWNDQSERRGVTISPMKLSFLIALLLHSCVLLSQSTTVVVATDGSGNFRTLQEAINAMPNHSSQRVVIAVKNGTYREKLVVPSWKTNIFLKGESAEKTIITWDDYSGKGNINTFNSYT